MNDFENLAKEAAEFEAKTDKPEGEDQAEFEPLDSKALAGVLVPVILTGGNIACARAKVTPLSQAEAAALSESLMKVAEQYDLQMSPKAAAWIGLGITAAAVIGNRKPLDDETTEQEVTADEAPNNG